MKKAIFRTLLIIQTVLILLFPAYAHAQSYNDGTYGGGVYNGSTANSTGGNSGATTGSNGGGLANTGQSALLFASIGAVVAGAGVIIVLRKRRK